jgi:hypothetical protein
MGIPFIIVGFPDRVLVDDSLREQLHIASDTLIPLKVLQNLVDQTFPDTPVVHVGKALQGLSGMYREDDTHLSDLGNLIAGTYVGEKLVEFFATSAMDHLETGKGY